MREDNTNLPILLNSQITRYSKCKMKNKINSFLTTFNKFLVFCHRIPRIVHYIFFSLSFYLLYCTVLETGLLFHITALSNQLSKRGSEKKMALVNKILISQTDFLCSHHWRKFCNFRGPKASIFFTLLFKNAFIENTFKNLKNITGCFSS